MTPQKTLGILFCAAILPLSASATWIDVYQGTASGDFKFKGIAVAYSGVDSAAANYDYFSHSGHPDEGPNLKYNRGELFFYDGPEGTTFNIVFNKEREQGDPPTQGAVSWNMIIADLTDPSAPLLIGNVLLSDDPREFKQELPGIFKGRWEWGNNTDGGIISGLTEQWAIVIDPKNYSGLDTLKVFSADGDRINMNVLTGPRGYLAFALHVPDGGSTLALLSVGILGLAAFSRRKAT